ncbi:hypothetical protein OFO01_07525 [Campylobacter sp. JMF_01 NE2]|uniref:hypothetical protein n=1 Tax=unclassified Campylobacter TaxID=2593542 RepID=UPI0022EA0A39|nr:MULTISPECIES: hypothetical protein [unclassified Campylobacter]MDA3053185.1 hypothetical protein [Campylobacter sp. JMF_03 NE3]MDA3067632.1 hypothetical protein [Campylobacter sp. JMF_01 NE2]
MKNQRNNPNFQLSAPLGFLYNQEKNTLRLQYFFKVEVLQGLESAVKICHKYLNLLNLIEKKDFLAFMTEMINLTGFHLFEKKFYENNPEYAVAEVINAMFNAHKHKDDEFFNMIFQYFIKKCGYYYITPISDMNELYNGEYASPNYNHDMEYIKDFTQRQEKELNIREEQLKLIEYEITKAQKENKIAFMNEVCKKGIGILREYLFIKSGIIVEWFKKDHYHRTHSIKVRTKEHIYEFESDWSDFKCLFHQIKDLKND